MLQFENYFATKGEQGQWVVYEELGAGDIEPVAAIMPEDGKYVLYGPAIPTPTGPVNNKIGTYTAPNVAFRAFTIWKEIA
jgi:hypothetical protein